MILHRFCTEEVKIGQISPKGAKGKPLKNIGNGAVASH